MYVYCYRLWLYSTGRGHAPTHIQHLIGNVSNIDNISIISLEESLMQRDLAQKESRIKLWQHSVTEAKEKEKQIIK